MWVQLLMPPLVVAVAVVLVLIGRGVGPVVGIRVFLPVRDTHIHKRRGKCLWHDVADIRNYKFDFRAT